MPHVDRAPPGSGRPLQPTKEDIVFITRTAVACVLACGLLAITAATAAAAPSPEERYLNSYGSPPAADALHRLRARTGAVLLVVRDAGVPPGALRRNAVATDRARLARDRRGRRRGRRHAPPSPPPRRAKRACLAVRHDVGHDITGGPTGSRSHRNNASTSSSPTARQDRGADPRQQAANCNLNRS